MKAVTESSLLNVLKKEKKKKKKKKKKNKRRWIVSENPVSL
jgi:predicted ribosome quality control (RQC) complex YloA/Tae2 family protein